MSALEIVYCFAVIVFAYALRGGTGFGAVLVMPLLALVIPMKALVPVWSILSVVAGASILRHDYRHIAWADFLLLQRFYCFPNKTHKTKHHCVTVHRV